jgi:hypothetical protein
VQPDVIGLDLDLTDSGGGSTWRALSSGIVQDLAMTKSTHKVW